MVEETSPFVDVPSMVSADEEMLIFGIGPHGAGAVVVLRDEIATALDQRITTHFADTVDPVTRRTQIVGRIVTLLNLAAGEDPQSVRMFNEAAAFAAWIAAQDSEIEREGRVDWVVYGVFGQEFLLALGRGDEGYADTRNKLVQKGASLYADCESEEPRTLH